MLEYTKKIRKIMTALGFRIKNPPYRVNPRGILFILVSLYLSIQTIYSMIKYWDDMPTRLASIEHIFVTLTVNIILIEYSFRPQDITVAMEISEKEFFGYKGIFVEGKEKFIDDSFHDINYGADLVFKLLLAESIAVAISPLIFIGWTAFNHYYLLDGDSTDPLEVKDFPLQLAYGSEHTKLYTYLPILVVQAVYLYGANMFAYCFSTATTFSIHSTTTDVAFFNMALKCYERVFSKFNDLDGGGDHLYKEEIKMRNVFREIVMHHKLIYRKCRLLTDKTGITLTVINNALSLFICFDIYSFVKGTGTAKFSCLFKMIPRISILYLYCFKGQKLSNESETMYQSIAELSWVDKPKWFKQCVLLMLTRSKSRIEVKPFGLYVVDLRNFSVVINAAYSYFNLFLRLS